MINLFSLHTGLPPCILMCVHTGHDENMWKLRGKWNSCGFFFVCVEVTPTQKSSEQPAALLIRREVTNSPRRFPTLPYLLSVSDKLPYWRGMFSRLTAGGGREESGKDRRKKKDPSQMYYLFKPTWSTQTASVCCQVQQVDKNSGRTLDKLLIWKQDSHRPVEEFCGMLSWGLPKRP